MSAHAATQTCLSWLTERWGEVETVAEDLLMVPFFNTATACFVGIRRVDQRSDGDPGRLCAEVFAPIVKDVELTPGLFRFIATNSDVPAFARLGVALEEAEVRASMPLMAETLTADTLNYGVQHVMETALELMAPIQQACGGRTLRPAAN